MRWTNIIDVERAMQLRRKGMKWKDIGKQIAKEQQRDNAYQAASVSNAIYKSQK